MRSLFWLVPCVGLAGSTTGQARSVDEVVTIQMQEHHLTGLSLAIIQDGRIFKAKGYGFADTNSQIPVTKDTLFQAGSISKSVAALGALRVVEQGGLSLDENVNRKLQTWRLPENEFTKDKAVTLRGILSHSAG